MSDEKKGFLARRAEGTKRYFGRRFGNTFINEVGRDTMRQTYSGARNAMRPQTFDRDEFNAGLDGRYEDGGAARFSAMVREMNLGEDDLLALETQRRQGARIMFAAAGLFFLVGVVMMITAGDVGGLFEGLATAITVFIFGALGARNDFSRWQIANRRFGGFREYLSGNGRPDAAAAKTGKAPVPVDRS